MDNYKTMPLIMYMYDTLGILGGGGGSKIRCPSCTCMILLGGGGGLRYNAPHVHVNAYNAHVSRLLQGAGP